MFIILGTNSSSQAFTFGTASKGQPFASQAAAERASRKIEQVRPSLDLLVLELHPAPAPSEG